MKHLNYNETFTLVVSAEIGRHANQLQNELMISGYKFTCTPNVHAPKLVDFSILVEGLQKFDKLNAIILSW